MKEKDARCFGECMGEIICCIYMIMRISTGQKYIGQTNNFYRRVNEHYSRNTMRIDKEISKYGKDDFIFQILEILPNDIEILNDREDFWVHYYNTYENPFHYNEKRGGCSHITPKHKIWNYANEICELYQNNYDISQYDLAEQFNCSQTVISEILRQNNIEVNYKRHKVWNYADEICELYKNTNVSKCELAKQFNCTDGTIFNILSENNIKLNGKSSKAWYYANEICDLYQNTNINIINLSKKFNCSPTIIQNILKQNNMEMNGKKNKAWYHVNEICRLYQNTNMNTSELGIMFNCHKNVIIEILKQNNIKVERRYRKRHEAWNHINEICDLYYNTNISKRKLAKQFNCSDTLINKIIKRRK